MADIFDIEEANRRLVTLLGKADRKYEKLLRSYERELKISYKRSLEEIKKRIAKMYEKYGDAVKYSEMTQYNRLTNLEQEIKREISRLKGESTRTTEKAIKEFYTESFYSSGSAINEALRVNLNFGKLGKETIQAIVLNPLDRITWPGRLAEHSKLYTNQIRQTLAQGIQQGDSYAKIARKITDNSKMSMAKTLRIIRTEGHRAQNAGRLLTYDKVTAASERLGIKTERKWLATSDDRTRNSHRSMDNKTAFVGEDGKLWFKFPSGKITEGPGLSGIPEEDIHCRCSTRIEIVELNN